MERGVFQLAETVEGDIWGDKFSMEAMHDRISSMARKVIPLRKPGSILNSSPVKSDNNGLPRRYTVLSNPRIPSCPSVPNVPPIVRSAKELKAEREREKAKLEEAFMVYEAVPVGSDAGVMGKGSKDLLLEDDPEMATFLPMLQDYLRVNDINIHETTANGSQATLSIRAEEDNNNDYVWDVFIHRTIPLEIWNQVALLGSVTGVPGDDSYPSDESEIEDEADEDSNDENWYANDYPDEEDSEDEDVYQKYEREW